MDRRLRGLSLYSGWIMVILLSGCTQTRLTDAPSGVQHHGTRMRPVAVICHPGSLEVVVHADLFDTGLVVDYKHLRLGSVPQAEGGPCGAVPSGEAEFSIRALLVDCGTTLSSTKEKIVYSNVLVYSPEPSPDGLFRLDEATLPVECHYDRKYAVDGVSLHPTWTPYVSRAAANSQIDFNLQLMADDWQSERGSYTYFLGDPIHFQVSVVMGQHMPLRAYVDHCVATATPDSEASLRYDFIEYYGCLVDAVLTKSSSRFLPRVEQRTLRFVLDAFSFHQEPSSQVYITCYLKAVPVTSPVSSQSQACSFINNRWQSVDGDDAACRSCAISLQTEEPPSRKLPETTEPSSASTREETFFQKSPEQNPALFVRPHPGMSQGQTYKPHETSGLKRESDEAARTLQLGPLVFLPPGDHVL